MKIDIKIEDNFGINDIISQLPTVKLFESEDIIKIGIIYTCGNFLNGEIFAILVAYVRYLQKSGKEVQIIYDPDEDCETIKYASRINFFKLLEVDFNEKFNRQSSTGRFVEITEFNHVNLWDIVHKTVKIFKSSLNVDNSILDCIYHCFGEVVDNVDIHSQSENGGVIYAQFFPSAQKIKIFIIDSGIGFHESLKSCEEYKAISHEDCLSKCCEKGVTDGKGKGIGLYHTSLFVQANNGTLIINSCGKELIKKANKEHIIDTPYWQGSIICLELRTNQSVDYNEVFKGYTPSTFEDLEECRNEKIEELW